MKKLFYTEKEVELLRREDRINVYEQLSKEKIFNKEEIAVIKTDCKRLVQDKDMEIKKAIADLFEFKSLEATKIKSAEQAIREKYEKAILELTEKCAVAESKNKEIEAQKDKIALCLEKENYYLQDRVNVLTETITKIANEKATVVTQTATPAQMVVVKQDGTPIQIVK